MVQDIFITVYSIQKYILSTYYFPEIVLVGKGDTKTHRYGEIEGKNPYVI